MRRGRSLVFVPHGARRSCAWHSAGRVRAFLRRARRVLLGQVSRVELARVWFIPECTLFVRIVPNGQNRSFEPSGEAPPQLLVLGGPIGVREFADGFAYHDRRNPNNSLTVYTDPASVMYQSAGF